MSQSKPKKVAIDGDIIAYRSAAAVEKRYIEATHKKSGRKMLFDNRTDFWGRGKKVGGKLAEINEEKGTNFTKEDFEVEDKFELEDLANALHITKTTIENICKSCNVKDYVVYLETEDTVNFRDEVATMVKYKDREAKKPEYLPQVKDYIIKYHNTIVAKDKETDDYQAIAAYEDCIQATIDKDAWMCNGTWIFNWLKMEKPYFVPEKGVGKVWRDDKGKVRAYGLKSLCFQMLVGDSVDNINPRALTDAKFGEVAAFNILDILKTPKQCLSVVVSQYKEWYPEPVTYDHWNKEENGLTLTKNWLEIAEEIFTLLWMKRSEEDSMTFEKLLKKYEVNYGE